LDLINIELNEIKCTAAAATGEEDTSRFVHATLRFPDIRKAHLSGRLFALW
jgi:hypothetical protein